MKEKLLIVGAGGLGRIVLEHSLQTYDCYFVDDGLNLGDVVCGTPIIGNTEDLQNLYSEFKNLIIAIGDNEIRRRLYELAKHIGYKIVNVICDSVYVSPFSTLGSGCVLLNNVVLQNGSTIGNGVVLNPGVEIHHDSTIGDFVLIYANSVIRTNTHIGNKVKIGSNVTVSNNTTINPDVVINDGSTI